MTGFLYIIIGEAVLLLVLAAILAMSSRTADSRKRVNERFAILAIEVDAEEGEITWRDRLKKRMANIFTRAGIHFDDSRWPLAITVFMAMIVIVTLGYGAAAGFMALVAAVIAFYAFLQFRYRQRAEALLSQLPRFIDNLERSLGTGCSLHAALVKAIERTGEPLQNVLIRVRNNVELGGDLGEQLQNAADTMAVKEFQLLALAVNVHQRYGGSIKGLLHSITTMVHQREQARREFSALTGETRFSAWVLGILPLLIAGYMVAVNPGYIESLWVSESGRNMLYLAVGFQITGGLILWRMVKSI